MELPMPFKTPAKLAAAELREYAARLLAGRALTVAELKQRLRRRAAEPASVDEIVAGLKEYHALDDQRLAESYAETRAGAGSFGKNRVLADLVKRKVAPRLAERAVANAYRDTDETAMIRDWLVRKYRNRDLGGLLAEPKGLASAYRRLRQAGFSSGASIRALKAYSAEAERLEEMDEGAEES
jgi:SOS response regulatory protein OraA/RecX